jgi:hypothetical protein
MPKLLIAFASATLLLASSGIWKANAATITNAGTLAPLTKSYTPAEKVAYWRRNIAGPIAAVITATATGTRIMAMPTRPTRITATPTGHTVITATAGDQVSASVSDVAGVGATNQQLYEAQLTKGVGVRAL